MPDIVNCRHYLAQTEQLEKMLETKRVLAAKITQDGLTKDNLTRYNTLERNIENVEVAIRIYERNILLFDCQSVS